ncbi:isochorismatase family cysteine hydrolase [Sphaerisporangium perillae]|uniref:isochorismatase family cysteine hydrolase n=1 Tax=Sphaerisporangium perillae TaxID=2935860 RepID=UPI00200F5FBE|nr:isochorismatase family cysteine hydrolase [Sphaerisporangium perillae]
MLNRSAVLAVVDVQNGFVREESAHVVPIIADLVKRRQTAGGEVVFTRYQDHEGSIFQRLFAWSKLMGSPEVDIVPELQPYLSKATAVIDKTIYSLFNDEGRALISQHGWTDIYVCGIATESCVLKTAADAFERDLTPWVIEDASASHAGEVSHEAGLLVTARFIGPHQLVRAAEIDPRHPGRESERRTTDENGGMDAALVALTRAYQEAATAIRGISDVRVASQGAARLAETVRGMSDSTVRVSSEVSARERENADHQ